MIYISASGRQAAEKSKRNLLEVVDCLKTEEYFCGEYLMHSV